MEKWTTFESIAYVWALALGTTALLTVLVSLGVGISDNSANVASWVQAVGSIAAIAAGFGVAWFQFAQADKKERLKAAETERLQMRNKCLAFSYRMRLFSGMMSSLVNNSQNYAFLWSMWEMDCDHLLDQLGAIPPDEYANPETAHEVAVIRVRLLAIVKTLKLGTDARNRSDLGQMDISEFDRWAEGLKNHAYAFSRYLDWLVERYQNIANDMSTDEERERIAAHQARMNTQFNLGHLSPSDTGKPQTPQPPEASR